MCGRYAQSVRTNGIEEIFEIAIGPSPEIIPSWNVAPMQPAAVVALDAAGHRAIRLHRWGLVPSWAWADPAAAARAINARVETVVKLPTFRAAFARRRCLVPATGFYEWQKAGKHKVAHLIHPTDQAVFAFAGRWV